MDNYMNVNQIQFKVIHLLGRGKGGYSYLVEKDGNYYVLKQIQFYTLIETQ